MESNKAKIEESNKKRLESLREKLDEYKSKKSIVRSSLNDLDNGIQKPKKIVFDDSDSGDEIKYEKPVIKESVKKEPTKNGESKKKFKLIESDSGSDSDSSDEKEAIKMFESKINLDDNKANQLIYLKSKYSNDDARFKIDDRFIEGDENNGENESEKTEKKSDSDKHITKKQIMSENLGQLKILEAITGKQIIRPKSMQDKENDLKRSMKNKLPGDNEINRNKMVRYDPTKVTHKVFELKKSGDSESSGSSSSSSSESEKEEKSEDEDDKEEFKDEDEEEEKSKEEESKFFKIEPNLKDLFSSTDVFKFKFTDDNEENEDEDEYQEEEEKAITIDKKKSMFMKDMGFDRFKKSNYSSSESEEEQDDRQVQVETKVAKKFLDTNINENKSFLPDFDQDTHIKDALVYFCRPKDADMDNLRKEWLEKREVLQKDCKKKHKKMVRIKRTKDNENLLPWMKKHHSESSQIKKRKK